MPRPVEPQYPRVAPAVGWAHGLELQVVDEKGQLHLYKLTLPQLGKLIETAAEALHRQVQPAEKPRLF